jgi:hypothetical protein
VSTDPNPATDEHEIPLTLGVGGPNIGTATVADDGTVTAAVTDPGIVAALSTPMRAYSIGTAGGDGSGLRRGPLHYSPRGGGNVCGGEGFASDRADETTCEGCKRERLVHDDPALAEQIREGVADAEAGRTVDLGSFARYLEGNAED